MARRKKGVDTKVYEMNIANVQIRIFKTKDGRYYYSLTNNTTQEQLQGKPYPAPECVSFLAQSRLEKLQW